MSRKDYRLIAECLRLERPDNDSQEEGYDIAIDTIADAMKVDNPNFDHNRFVEATR